MAKIMQIVIRRPSEAAVYVEVPDDFGSSRESYQGFDDALLDVLFLKERTGFRDLSWEEDDFVSPVEVDVVEYEEPEYDDGPEYIAIRDDNHPGEWTITPAARPA